MKAILKFDLDNHDDRIAHTMCMNASKLSLIIWDLEQWLRDNCKYNKGDISVKDADKVRDVLRSFMDNYDLTFDNEIFS